MKVLLALAAVAMMSALCCQLYAHHGVASIISERCFRSISEGAFFYLLMSIYFNFPTLNPITYIGLLLAYARKDKSYNAR